MLEAAARLQEVLPDAVLVGGSAAAYHAGHRVSFDDGHVLTDLRDRFDEVLAALEQTDGWVTTRIRPQVLILGSLDGVETGIRQLIRRRPLEVEQATVRGRRLRVPTIEEIFRIKAWLVLRRNATRDYLDVVALADRLGVPDAARVIVGMDDYYEISSVPAAGVLRRNWRSSLLSLRPTICPRWISHITGSSMPDGETGTTSSRLASVSRPMSWIC